MGVHHSEETHANLLARVPQATGRDLKEWFHCVEDGPSFTRFDERVHWLQDEHEVSHGYGRGDRARVRHAAGGPPVQLTATGQLRLRIASRRSSSR